MSMKEKTRKMNRNDKKAGRKLTKKQVYAKYGIEYDSKTGKILSPIGYINELLKEGNSKTGKLVYTFSLLPGKFTYTLNLDGIDINVLGTCCCNCNGCYAMTGFYITNSVIRSMAMNTFLVNNHITFVKNAISAQLEYMGRGEIRIHASGDFNTLFPDAYASMWHDIAKNFPSFRFWTYTKVKRFETLFDDLKNANIVKSVIPGIGINFGHCDYIINAYYTLLEMGKSVYICKCGIDKNQHCERCGVCSSYDYVLFLEHSTDYKPEADPLYGKFIELVNNQ